MGIQSFLATPVPLLSLQTPFSAVIKSPIW